MTHRSMFNIDGHMIVTAERISILRVGMPSFRRKEPNYGCSILADGRVKFWLGFCSNCHSLSKMVLEPIGTWLKAIATFWRTMNRVIVERLGKVRSIGGTVLERIANLIQRFDLDFKHVKSQSIKFLST
jgi:hypothetical protein